MNRYFIVRLPAFLLFIFQLVPLACTHEHIADLRQSFVNPPDTCRPGVYWYFMDGNIEREAITADLESMREAGIGYVVFLEVNVGIPRGKVDFLSNEWLELYEYAVRESERLGIRIILGSGPGWAGSGGPWISPSRSMMHLVASETVVSGPASFNEILPLPQPRKPFFGEESLTPELKNLRDEWYEDVAVLAFPSPSKNVRISIPDEKALYYRAPYTSQKGVLPYLVPDAEMSNTHGTATELDQIVDLTGRLDDKGRLRWEIPSGKWTIMRFIKRNNGAVTRPAPLPGLGFECDKFDTAAFDFHYNAYIGKLLEKCQPLKPPGEGGWTMIHIDSWEMGAQNWSNSFREEFLRRRGYNPLPYLPSYSGIVVENMETTERFLWDVRQTSNELIVENHAQRFKELGRRNGFRLSIEPYDMNPAADLDLGLVADVPMCEFWSEGFGFNSSFSCIEAASVAHIKGAPVVAAEAFTADAGEAWKKYPGNMKNQGDWAFCMGINRLVYHTFAHKPYGDKHRPGMTMGPYGVHWDRGQTWWPMVKDYHKYITRCQYLLSQGRSVADILYLVPEGAPQVFLPPGSALEGTAVMPDKKGYAFDGCSPSFLIKYAEVRNKKIVFPGGGTYHLLVLPDLDTMTPELLSKIKELIQEGATVAGNPPVKSPSLSGFPSCDQNVKALAEDIWGNLEKPAGLEKIIFGQGNVWWGYGLINPGNGLKGNPDSLVLYPEYNVTAKILADNGIRPDFKASGNIRYAHRSLPSCEIYFISNRTGSQITDTCFFRDGTAHAEAWDALDGRSKIIIKLYYTADSTFIPVKLKPYQSLFIVFSDRPQKGNNKPVSYLNTDEKDLVMNIEGKWLVEFDTTWGGPSKIEFSELTDWTERPEEGIRYYSGVARYSTTFELPGTERITDNIEYYLNLGKVKNIAKVWLNGIEVGVAWTEPWEISLNDAINNGKNNLVIEVANLWINRLIGDEVHPWDGIESGQWPEWFLDNRARPTERLAFTTHRYYGKNDTLMPSGLTGRVRLYKTHETHNADKHQLRGILK